MEPIIFIDENETDKYNASHLTIEKLIDCIAAISEKNELAIGYMVRHSKMKGISYNSDDEYVDQFITLYMPSKNNKKEAGSIMKTACEKNAAEDKSENDNISDVPEEDIHDVSFEVKHSIDYRNMVFYIHDPGVGNRITLGAILNVLQDVVSENNNFYDYSIKYRSAESIYEINEILVCSKKKSIKFH
jgi:hypothetical protein